MTYPQPRDATNYWVLLKTSRLQKVRARENFSMRSVKIFNTTPMPMDINQPESFFKLLGLYSVIMKAEQWKQYSLYREVEEGNIGSPLLTDNIAIKVIVTKSFFLTWVESV